MFLKTQEQVKEHFLQRIFLLSFWEEGTNLREYKL